MAFITLEDRYAEIEVIVFAKQYKQYSELLNEELGVIVTGSISSEDSESPKILLSTAEVLYSNSDYQKNALKSKAESKYSAEKRIYIRVPSLLDDRIEKIHRISALNSGETQIVLFDEGTKKYSILKGARVSSDERVLSRFSSIFSPENVIFK